MCIHLFQWLSVHSRVDWAGIKLIQILAQQVQALICWVITIKPETCIAGVIVSAVEVLQPVVQYSADCTLLSQLYSTQEARWHCATCV